MVFEELAPRSVVSYKVTLCRGKLKQHDNHEFFDWLPTFLPSTESLRLGRTKRYVPDDNLIYGSLPLSSGTYRVNTILCLGRLAFMSILWSSFSYEVPLSCPDPFMFREDGFLQSYWIIEVSLVGTSESRRSSRDLLCLDALVLVTSDCRRPLKPYTSTSWFMWTRYHTRYSFCASTSHWSIASGWV